MRIPLLLAAALAATPFCASAQQAAEGRNLAAGCAICHGTEGRPAPNAPLVPLAGLPRDYLATQMRAFRDGKRPATVMHQIAKGYSDPQIEAMATWFAAQKR
ncbi:MAG: cytochrome C [Betaproteobacteria bacterium RIFCSPLOWO2_12_FULL_68_20]|nr:MAG: cytochrome C [Betaproteobacteria bacterium RIFCSPLOWO2_12_FULL_68_20]